MDKKQKIEDAISDLNAIRAVYHRELKEFEKQYKNKKISKEEFDKHKENFEGKRQKIREKIQNLEEKLEQLR
jgi:hypothetical protein